MARPTAVVHERVSTDDPDAAYEYLRTIYAEHIAEMPGDLSRFDFSLDSPIAPDLRVARLRLSTGYRGTSALAHGVTVLRVREGTEVVPVPSSWLDNGCNGPVSPTPDRLWVVCGRRSGHTFVRVARRAVTFRLAPDLASASIARERVRSWLTEQRWPSDVTDDLVLAVSEAVTNSTEHAFLGQADAGRVDDPFIQVDCLCPDGAEESREVRVAISDNGRWKPPDLARRYRGYGITTMHAVVDTFRLHTDGSGTTVELLRRIPVVRTQRSVPDEP